MSVYLKETGGNFLCKFHGTFRVLICFFLFLNHWAIDLKFIRTICHEFYSTVVIVICKGTLSSAQNLVTDYRLYCFLKISFEKIIMALKRILYGKVWKIDNNVKQLKLIQNCVFQDDLFFNFCMQSRLTDTISRSSTASLYISAECRTMSRVS